MTKKKKNSFVDKLAKQIREEYNIKVNIINNFLNMKDIQDIQNLSITVKDVTLIKRNSNTETLFKNNNVNYYDKIAIIIYNGTANCIDNDVNIKTILTCDLDT